MGRHVITTVTRTVSYFCDLCENEKTLIVSDEEEIKLPEAWAECTDKDSGEVTFICNVCLDTYENVAKVLFHGKRTGD